MGSLEAEDPPPRISSSSWLTVAKQKKVMKRYDFEISDLEGKKSVEVPSAIVEKADLLWDDFIIAKFLEEAPHVAKVHVILNKIWAFGDKDQKLDVYEMDATTMRVRIQNPAVREKVIRRGMWNIAGIPMVASKWSPIEDESNGTTPLWVHLSNVPMNMYSWQGLSFISSAAGIPDRLHPETLACTNFEIAKICVKADLSKPLPNKIDYKINGEDVTVEFNYPWLPNRCEGCGKWGHLEIKCGKKGKKEEVEQKQDTIGKNEGKKEEESVQGKKDDVEITNVQKSKQEMEVEEGQIEEKWLTPGKTGRSSGKQAKSLKYGEVKIITPSRYSALSVSEEEEKEKGSEKNIEVNQKEVTEEKNKQMDIEEETNLEVNEEEMEGMLDDSQATRQFLPRESKTRHRVLSDVHDAKVMPSKVSKKGTRKNLH